PNPFVHWLVWSIDPSRTELPEGVPATESNFLMQGKNSGLKSGWTGMAPPKGDTPHHYVFQLFALNTGLQLEPGAGRSALVQALKGKVIGRGQLVGTYQR
ncbi:MAG: YbhB/YbcL family Raf kinase inhibitor-like protein, partial [Phycisphaerae bacterium]|nr:YbhB/YbcL family Raf kinase inhibitor-like protein [Phycisphaerae bacterium]